MKQPLNVGVIAPSSVVPPVELAIGLEHLESLGFHVQVHPQVKKKHLFFAGTDEERAQAILDYAFHPEIDLLWCARGGYGAQRLLPLLEEKTLQKGIPEQKLLVGFSDITALMEFVRTKWQWATLHAPMVANQRFSTLPKKEWSTLISLIETGKLDRANQSISLKILHIPKSMDPIQEIRGQIVGGNLAVWGALYGTPYQPITQQKILFFEDISETPSKIDRMIQQLAQAGAFHKVKAIILGDFVNCEDQPPSGLIEIKSDAALKKALKHPKKNQLAPVRPRLSQKVAFASLFKEISERFNVPIFSEFPSGHGSKQSPIPLGSETEIIVQKAPIIQWMHWSWGS